MPVPTRSFQPLTIVTDHRPPHLGLGMARQTRWHLSGVDRLSSIRPSSQPLRGTESSTQISRDVFSLRGTNMAKTGMTCSDASSYDLFGHHGMRQCLGVALRREKPGPGPGPVAEINEQPAGRTHYARLRSGGPAVRGSPSHAEPVQTLCLCFARRLLPALARSQCTLLLFAPAPSPQCPTPCSHEA